jgi:hypothetical protein
MSGTPRSFCSRAETNTIAGNTPATTPPDVPSCPQQQQIHLTHREELCPQGLGLLPDSLTRVKHAHNRTHALRAADGSQASHASTDDQHLGRGHLAGCGDLAGEEAAKVVRGLNHSPAAHIHDKLQHHWVR